MLIYHLALESQWREARAAGLYTTSTVGLRLDEVGFIHASRREQVDGVHDRFYRTVSEPLVLLEIDTDRLTSPWREDPVGDDTFPHVYGPINADAVVSARPWPRGPESHAAGSESPR